MRTANGLFAASLDADTDHHEGTTYVWTAPEVAAALGAEAFAFAQAYGLSDQGNFEGKNIPKLKGDQAARGRFAPARAKLLALRDRRPQPARDDKNLVSWNALLVTNLAKAGWIFGRVDWVELALELEAGLWRRFAVGQGRRLRSVAQGEQVGLEGNLSDYAWLVRSRTRAGRGRRLGPPRIRLAVRRPRRRPPPLGRGTLRRRSCRRRLRRAGPSRGPLGPAEGLVRQRRCPPATPRSCTASASCRRFRMIRAGGASSRTCPAPMPGSAATSPTGSRTRWTGSPGKPADRRSSRRPAAGKPSGWRCSGICGPPRTDARIV